MDFLILSTAPVTLISACVQLVSHTLILENLPEGDSELESVKLIRSITRTNVTSKLDVSTFTVLYSSAIPRNTYVANILVRYEKMANITYCTASEKYDIQNE